MSKRQNYQNRNRGFRRLTALMTQIAAFAGNALKWLTNSRQAENGKAGDHLHTGYQSGGGSGGNTKKQKETKVFKTKEQKRKKAKRQQVRYSKRVNRKRSAGVCSFK